MNTKTDQIFDSFTKLKVAVIGDLMLDTYIKGKVTRISPEAPVPIVNRQITESRLGGAGNVALNIKALGAECFLFSIIGSDTAAAEVVRLIQDADIKAVGMIKSEKRPTTQKTRVLGNNVQLLRIDDESITPISEEEFDSVKLEWNKFISNTKPDVVILQDYNKGFLTQDLINFILESCQKNKIKVCVDPKKDNFFAYKNVDLFKPNIKELSEGLGVHINTQDEHSIQSAISLLESKINPQSILLTLSEKGVWYQTKSKSVKVNAHLRNIADVSGAGDTVISIAALCLALNLDAQILAEMSNLGGGLVCEKIGVVSVDKIELKREFNRISV